MSMTYFAKLWIMPIVCGWSNGNARGEAEAHPPVITRPTKYPAAVFRDTGYSSNLDHPYSTTLSPKQPACGEKNLQKLNLIGNKSRPRVVWGARPMTLAGFLRSIADQRPRCHHMNVAQGESLFCLGGAWGGGDCEGCKI